MSDYLQRLVERHLGNTAAVLPNANSYVSVGAELPTSPVPAEPVGSWDTESADAINDGAQQQPAVPRHTNNASGAPESIAIADRAAGETSAYKPSATASNPNRDQDIAASPLTVTARTIPPPAVRNVEAAPIALRPDSTSQSRVESVSFGQGLRDDQRVAVVASSTLPDVGDTVQPSNAETVGPIAAILQVASPRNIQHDQVLQKMAPSKPTSAAVSAYPAALAPTVTPTVHAAALELRASPAEYSEWVDRSLSATAAPIAAKPDLFPRARTKIPEAPMASEMPSVASLAAHTTSVPVTSARDTHAAITADTPTTTVPAWIPPIRPAANARSLPIPSAPPVPNISITIGTIEVRAAAPMPAPAAAPPRAGPRLSLDDYLRRRNGGGA